MTHYTPEQAEQYRRVQRVKAEILAEIAARPKKPSLLRQLTKELRSVRAQVQEARAKGEPVEALLAKEHELCRDISTLHQRTS